MHLLLTLKDMLKLFNGQSLLRLKLTPKKSQVNKVRTFYDVTNQHSTIYSLSSAIKESTGSPIGVIRVSGNRTTDVLSIITKRNPLRNSEQGTNLQHKKKMDIIRPRYATLSKIYSHHVSPDEFIDNGLVLWFPKPNSFTGEDVCEFHLHGSQSIISSILSTLATIDGCRPAESGEFSRRAFENKKMDLTMVEGIADLIASKTDTHRRMALSAVSGETRNLYSTWSNQLATILGHLEASIDFGEDELIGETQVVDKCLADLKDIKESLKKHVLLNSQRSELIRNGIKIAILGPPNAGKSTFMNLLCQKDLSIVSDISGTTRDVIEHSVQLGGFAAKICDTAGLRNLLSRSNRFPDPIEEEGIKRAINRARVCDIMLYIVDISTIARTHKELVDIMCKDLKVIIDNIASSQNEDAKRPNKMSIMIVLNKLDKVDGALELTPELVQDIHSTLHELLKYPIISSEHDMVTSITIDAISCKTRLNLEKFISRLIDTLREVSRMDDVSCESDYTYITERHISHLNSIIHHLEKTSSMGFSSLDLIAQHVRESIDHISRITGAITNDRVLDIIFRDFCIGK